MNTTIPGDLIAITISPPDRSNKYPYKLKNVNFHIFCEDKLEIVRLLNRTSIEYTLYPEFDMNGRLHYHGIVIVKNKTNWLRTTLPGLKRIGFVCVKTNPDAKWTQYCTKEWEVTKKVLQIDKPIMYEKLKPGPKVNVIKEVNKISTNILDMLASGAA